MADRRETHVWTDGEAWHVYSERAFDIRKFERWFGAPVRRGRDNECAAWELPADALRLRAKANRPSKSPSESQLRAREAFREARRATGASNPPKTKENSLPPRSVSGKATGR